MNKNQHIEQHPTASMTEPKHMVGTLPEISNMLCENVKIIFWFLKGWIELSVIHLCIKFMFVHNGN